MVKRELKVTDSVGYSKKEYKTFFNSIKDRIYKAQYEALKVVNKNLIDLYWWIGQSIVEKQEKLGWGKSVVETLSEDLQNEFPGVRGYSVQNLWNMRHFYLSYNGNEKLQPLVGEISWAKHILVFQKCKEDAEKEFYIRMTKKYGWTKTVLTHHIMRKSYEKYLLNQTNFDQALPEKYKNQAKLAVKDFYSFEFLGMGEDHSERELELGLLKNIRKFLLEMGNDFTFVGHQYKLELDDDEIFYIDLLLYHRQLRSLVAIELKKGKFLPEYAGKMQFYLSVLNDREKLEDENPAIGIIICQSKNRTVVEYALKDSQKPIGVASYTISDTLPKAFENYLPSPEEISERMSIFEESD